MINYLSHLTILVKNQDEALKFYTEKIGFEKHTDAQFGQMRWLTLNPKGSQNLEFALMLPESQEDLALVGKQGGSFPLACMITDNCKKDYEEMKSRGVEFIMEPTTEEWGTQAVFKDLYGNMFNMVELPK
ncbi:MAG TPA: VOC family protein [Candidatus Babeliales bacterium]|nr:VOC family protein [Candidatus Babeliales bacterium]